MNAFNVDHKPTASSSRLLESLKIEAMQAGRDEDWIEESRRENRAAGWSESKIAACEFAELRLFADASQDVMSIAAIAGTPSEVTMALVERDGYCPSCVRFWYATFADAFRRNMGD